MLLYSDLAFLCIDSTYCMVALGAERDCGWKVKRDLGHPRKIVQICKVVGGERKGMAYKRQLCSDK